MSHQFYRYAAPKLAIANLYWKAWILLAIVASLNPSSIGKLINGKVNGTCGSALFCLLKERKHRESIKWKIYIVWYLKRYYNINIIPRNIIFVTFIVGFIGA